MTVVDRQRGNILFLILLAVVVFAALATALTSSLRGGGKDATPEMMRAALSQITNVVTAHRQAIQRMVISGIDPDSISAYWGGVNINGQYIANNAKCPWAGANNACKLYHPDGGGLTYYDFPTAYPKLAVGPYNPTSNGVYWSTWFYYPGTAAYDLHYVVHVTKTFCDFVNQELGVPALDTFTDQGSVTTPSGLGMVYTLGGPGFYTPSTSAPTGWGSKYLGPNLNNKEMGCIHTLTNTDSYYIIALLYSF